MTVVGIDVGTKGGLTALDDTGALIESVPMPRTKDKTRSFFGDVADFIRKHSPSKVMIEQVGAMPKQGVVSMFKFGTNFGGLLGVVEALKVPYELIRPQAWRKLTLANDIKAMKIDNKKQVEIMVKRLWPSANWIAPRCRTTHDGMTDSALIALSGI
ncbi:hypothetical protein [Flavobacterium alkalisoli]|uniref:hypothetical protein n=1 Tax=Flavobacterium alkalisoli TaxID=2602769 RepID=UPI003A90D610